MNEDSVPPMYEYMMNMYVNVMMLHRVIVSPVGLGMLLHALTLIKNIELNIFVRLTIGQGYMHKVAAATSNIRKTTSGDFTIQV